MANEQRLVRIVLVDVQARSQEVTVDLVVDGDQVRRGIPHFGLWVDKDQGARCPFVLDETGEADFGTGYNGDDRIYQTDLLEAEIGMGQQIGWKSGDYETQLKVIGITQLI